MKVILEHSRDTSSADFSYPPRDNILEAQDLRFCRKGACSKKGSIGTVFQWFVPVRELGVIKKDHKHIIK